MDEATTFEAAPPSLRLDILLCHEDGAWVGHCLQLDIVAAGKTPDEAFHSTQSACMAQIDYAFHANKLGTLFKPPEPALLLKMFKARAEGCLNVEMKRHDSAPHLGFQIQRLTEAAS